MHVLDRRKLRVCTSHPIYFHDIGTGIPLIIRHVLLLRNNSLSSRCCIFVFSIDQSTNHYIQNDLLVSGSGHFIPNILNFLQHSCKLTTSGFHLLGLTDSFVSVCEAILVLILGRREWFVAALGYFALGLESTLPLPQLIRCVRMFDVLRKYSSLSQKQLSSKVVYFWIFL